MEAYGESERSKLIKLKKPSFIFLIIMLQLLMIITGCTEQGIDFGDKYGFTAAPRLNGKVTVSGSTSMEDLVNALGSEFTKIYPGIFVDVQSGGSSVGISNAKDKITDIGNSSRTLKTEEKSFGLKEYIIAIDGIAVIVNPSSNITNLTSEQLKKVFTGEIDNWKELGGNDAVIVAIGREAGSGTRDGFEEVLNIKNKAKYDVEANETGLVKTKVKQEKYAIGYISVGKLDDTVKALKIDNVAPTDVSIKDKSYSMQRPFVCLTKDESETVNTKAFLEFILSGNGQEIVAKQGYSKVK